MAITPTSSVPVNSAGKSASESGALNLANNYDNFLLLLVTQLKNQDPTEPLDTNQFTQQLISLTNAEQSVAMNKNLETLISLTQNSQITDAAAYIGKTIIADGDSGELRNGQAFFYYDMPGGVNKANIAIVDSTGTKTLYTQTIKNTAGPYVFNWNGADMQGNKQPDGIYRVVIQAYDGTGKAVEATTHTSGVVTGVKIEEGVPTIAIGEIAVPLDKVTQVIATTTPTSSNTNNTDNANDNTNTPSNDE